MAAGLVVPPAEVAAPTTDDRPDAKESVPTPLSPAAAELHRPYFPRADRRGLDGGQIRAMTGTTGWDESIRDLAQEHHAVQYERELQQLGSRGKLPLAQRDRRVRYEDTFDPEGPSPQAIIQNDA